jgi:hypothetical protein
MINQESSNMKELNFKVTIDEANLILEGLGHIPFAQVFTLVAKIQEQAQQQLNGEDLPGKEPDEGDPKPTIKA